MKILFLGSSDFALPALDLLMYSRWRLLGAVTQPDRPKGRGRKLGPTPVKQFAREQGLTVYQPSSGAGLADLLASERLAPEVIVVVAFGQLLPSAVLDRPPLGCVNIHPSLLPAYRGPAPLQRAIINGEAMTGVTTMYLNPEMDAGDLILQEAVAVGPATTTGELSEQLARLGAELLHKTLCLIEQGRAPRQAQDHARATYAPALTPGEERIDWNRDAVSLSNLIRGMNPHPGAHTLLNGKELKIWRGLPGDSSAGGQPGSIGAVNPRSGFSVQTGRGQLLIEEVQPAGRSRMSGAEYVRGYRIRPGLLLGG